VPDSISLGLNALPIITLPEAEGSCSSGGCSTGGSHGGGSCGGTIGAYDADHDHEPELIQVGGGISAIDMSDRRLPKWLKRNIPKGNANHFTEKLLSELRLETVCDNAKCPNRMECYSQKTATFMILGNVCTRPCGFCSVAKGKTQALEDDEPERVAEASYRMGLKHVVITSVTRDDLPDGGAEHFYRCVLAVRERTGAAVEVLTPDFLGKPGAIERVVESAPEVFNHNTETVPRLYREVRGRKSEYKWTLELLRRVKRLNPKVLTKSGLMLGLGETRDELFDVLADLRDAGCDMLTLGQYLQPTLEHLPVTRYVPPAEFDELGAAAKTLGFMSVASGPFVRSSYHAREMAEA
jgi:lipoic acid synthetase